MPCPRFSSSWRSLREGPPSPRPSFRGVPPAFFFFLPDSAPLEESGSGELRPGLLLLGPLGVPLLFHGIPFISSQVGTQPHFPLALVLQLFDELAVASHHIDQRAGRPSEGERSGNADDRADVPPMLSEINLSVAERAVGVGRSISSGVFAVCDGCHAPTQASAAARTWLPARSCL
jgi:hypothetical protein